MSRKITKSPTMGHPVIIRLWALALLSAYGAVAFDTDWTRLWSTVHDGDDPIERELLGRLANAKGRGAFELGWVPPGCEP